MNLQASAVTLPIAAGIMAYGFQQKSSIAFLATIAILLSALWYSTYAMIRIRSIGGYIYAVIEPKIEGLQWHTILVTKRKNERIGSGNSATIGAIVIYMVVSLACLFLTWVFLQDRSFFNLTIYGGLALFLLLLLVIGSIRAVYIASVNYYEASGKEWKKIEEEVNRRVTTIAPADLERHEKSSGYLRSKDTTITQ